MVHGGDRGRPRKERDAGASEGRITVFGELEARVDASWRTQGQLAAAAGRKLSPRREGVGESCIVCNCGRRSPLNIALGEKLPRPG